MILMRTSIVVGLLGVLAVATAHAEVVATARSPGGEFGAFQVVLDAVGAPVAVANFMGLADGSQRWVDPETGQVRGGADDAFYAGMVFDFPDGEMIRGGLRPIADREGGTAYTGGPGYTVPGKETEAWTATAEGTLTLVEMDGPHSGGGELALHLTNGVTPWTVLGRVKEADLAGVRELAATVKGGKITSVEWTLDASGATAEELAALEAAKDRLPEAFGVVARVDADGKGFSFEWPGKSRMLVMTGDDLTKGKGFSFLAEGWHEVEETETAGLQWEWLELTGSKGFVSLAEAEYPAWSGHLFTGKWWMELEYADHREEIWWDFLDGMGAGTGMVVTVEGNEITKKESFSQANSWRVTGNSILSYYGIALNGHYHYLGFAKDGAEGGRFMRKKTLLLTELERTWGTFKLEEGWKREPGEATIRTVARKPRANAGSGAAVPPGRECPIVRGMSMRRMGGGERRAAGNREEEWRSGRVEELELGVFGEGDARAEESDAFFDVVKHGAGFGDGRGTEKRGDIRFNGDGLAELSVEGECDGEGVADDGVVGVEGVGAAGDGQDIGRGGG